MKFNQNNLTGPVAQTIIDFIIFWCTLESKFVTINILSPREPNSIQKAVISAVKKNSWLMDNSKGETNGRMSLKRREDKKEKEEKKEKKGMNHHYARLPLPKRPCY